MRVLVGVVGPSGAGKDTLMEGARAALAGDAAFRFVRRSITRPAESGGEAHDALDREAFLAAVEAGAFALWWEAHGLLYGIPADIVADIAAGRVVVANLSRGVLRDAHRRLRLRVLEITAPRDVLAGRLAARGRETRAEIVARLTREMTLPPGLDVVRVVNNGAVEDGVAAVVRALRDARG